MANQKYLVKTQLFNGEWEDCWTDGDGNPLRFDSPQEAQDEIDELISGVAEAVKDGDMSDEYDPNDYKIFSVTE